MHSIIWNWIFFWDYQNHSSLTITMYFSYNLLHTIYMHYFEFLTWHVYASFWISYLFHTRIIPPVVCYIVVKWRRNSKSWGDFYLDHSLECRIRPSYSNVPQYNYSNYKTIECTLWKLVWPLPWTSKCINSVKFHWINE